MIQKELQLTLLDFFPLLLSSYFYITLLLLSNPCLHVYQELSALLYYCKYPSLPASSCSSPYSVSHHVDRLWISFVSFISPSFSFRPSQCRDQPDPPGEAGVWDRAGPCGVADTFGGSFSSDFLLFRCPAGCARLLEVGTTTASLTVFELAVAQRLTLSDSVFVYG